ncbi:MAG: DNA primase [Sedimentisphaerales bacterium]|nr:DNA primase [Sedimentisphaerales bacterium]
MSVIEEVKQKTDIVEIVGQYTKLTKAGKNLKGLCPFHSEKHGSFFIYPDEQRWHCFGACNEGGDVFSFIMKQQNITFGDALRILAEKAGIEVPSIGGQKEDREKYDKIYQVNQAAAQYFHNILINTDYGVKGKNYIVKRGLNEKSITDFQLGFSLNSRDSLKNYLLDKGYTEKELFEAGAITTAEGKDSYDVFRNRLMFPIMDIKGKCCGFGGRTFEDNQAKYINSPQTAVFDKSGNLYGINLASQSIRKEDLAVLVEGYMDVIMAHQYGFSNVVASMGTAVTEKQMNTLKKLTKNLILALDSDIAGEEAMLRCVSYENLIQNEIKVAIMPAGSDPDDVIRKDSSEWQKLLNNAIPVIDYTFDIVTAKLDLSTARDKTFASNKLLPIITQVEDRIRRAHYMQKLSHLVGISVRELESIVKKPVEYSKYNNKNKGLLSDSMATPTFSQPLEEYCLTLLLQFPKLKSFKHKIKPEYFENSENREVFFALSKTEDLNNIKTSLDSSIWDYLDQLIKREVPPDKIEQKMSFCILRLHEKFLRKLEMKREVIFAAEAASKGSTAGLSKLEEQGIGNSNELREVFSKKSADSQYRGDINETGKQ